MPKDAQTALPELETPEFIKEGRNIVFCGNPGTGKTHLSIGIGITGLNQLKKMLQSDEE